MKCGEVVKLAALFIGDNDVLSAIDEQEKAATNGSQYTMSDSVAKKLKRYMSCVNLTMDRIASNYITFKNIDSLVTDTEGKIAYTSFSGKILEIRKVVDALSGIELQFISLPFHLYVPHSMRKVMVEYKVKPDAISSLNTTIKVPPILTDRVIAYGVVSDYLLSQNVYDESKYWNEKFEKAIAASLTHRHNLHLARRQFM